MAYETELEAIHIAAGLGSVEAMEALCQEAEDVPSALATGEEVAGGRGCFFGAFFIVLWGLWGVEEEVGCFLGCFKVLWGLGGVFLEKTHHVM